MANIVRAALVQTKWTGDKQSMIDLHIDYARKAASQGGASDVLPGAVLRAVLLPRCRTASTTTTPRPIPDGPTTQRMCEVAKELNMVLVVPMYEQEQEASLQHRGGHRRRRHVPRQVPQDAHPAGEGLLGEVLLPAREHGLPVFDTAVGRSRRLHLLTTATSPRAGVRSACRGEDRASTRRPRRAGSAPYLWQLERRRARRHEYYIGAHQPVWHRGSRRQRLLRPDVLRPVRVDSSSATSRPTPKSELLVRDLDMDHVQDVRNQWAFYRDRRSRHVRAVSPRR
jgi:N-carbamoylputrescine amidase